MRRVPLRCSVIHKRAQSTSENQSKIWQDEAAKNGHVEFARFLVEFGANAKTNTKHGETWLELAGTLKLPSYC